MSHDSRNVIMLGLPETGKTSFLAAFLHYVESDLPDKSMSQYQLSSNTEYTTAIVKDWLKGKRPERTKITATQNSNTLAEIYLEHAKSSTRFTLYVPDFYGETFEAQFVDRLIESSYVDQIKMSDGIIVFIHPTQLKRPTLIDDIAVAFDVEQAINESTNGNNEDESTDKSNNEPSDNDKSVLDIVQFQVDQCPTQLIIADLLEAHLEYLSNFPMKISVVISAWDIIRAQQLDISPSRWLEKNLPLLYQYLTCNEDKIVHKVFGVSAQGGDISNDTKRSELVELPEPANRIIVKEEDKEEHNNIALPIEWILEQWKS